MLPEQKPTKIENYTMLRKFVIFSRYVPKALIGTAADLILYKYANLAKESISSENQYSSSALRDLSRKFQS